MHTASRRSKPILAGFLLAAAVVTPAFAHHGWSWTENGFFQIEGVITEVYVGNPHATIDVDVEGTIWRVELAPPGPTTGGRLHRGGRAGRRRSHRHRQSLRRSQRTRMKAVRVIIGDETYDVYPDRAQDI